MSLERAIVGDSEARSKHAAAITPSGFFVLRTPLLPFDELLNWSDGLEAPVAAPDDRSRLERALAADRTRLRERLRDAFSRREVLDALQVPAMAQALEARRQGRLMRIEAALQRLDSGDYGFCEECGESIPAKRLEIDPATERCVDCAL